MFFLLIPLTFYDIFIHADISSEKIVRPGAKKSAPLPFPLKKSLALISIGVILTVLYAFCIDSEFPLQPIS